MAQRCITTAQLGVLSSKSKTATVQESGRGANYSGHAHTGVKTGILSCFIEIKNLTIRTTHIAPEIRTEASRGVGVGA